MLALRLAWRSFLRHRRRSIITGAAIALAASGDVVLRTAAGATFKPATKLTLSPELLYNGFGSPDAAAYLGVAASDRVAAGEQILLDASTPARWSTGRRTRCSTWAASRW